MDHFTRNGLTFDVRDTGPADGPVVVLLHGFPQHNDSWDAVIDRLTAQGYRCLAPNQRGYSAGARPPRRRDYRIAELVADLRALIEASGAEQVHLVGHDWGAAVAWAAAAEMPERLLTVSPVSVPHPGAFLKSFLNSRQGLASWYMFAFPVAAAAGVDDGATQRRHDDSVAAAGRPVTRRGRARRTGDAGTGGPEGSDQLVSGDAAVKPTLDQPKVSVPTLYVWSDQDIALMPKAAHNTGCYVTGDYRFEIMPGVSHWIPDEEPDRLADLLLEWFAAH